MSNELDGIIARLSSLETTLNDTINHTNKSNLSYPEASNEYNNILNDLKELAKDNSGLKKIVDRLDSFEEGDFLVHGNYRYAVKLQSRIRILLPNLRSLAPGQDLTISKNVELPRNKKSKPSLLKIITLVSLIIGILAAIVTILAFFNISPDRLSQWWQVSNKENQKIDEDKKTYVEKMNIADKIFIEVLSNLKEINAHLDEGTLEKGDMKFQFDNHDKWYTSFGIGELDRQIDNFYVSLKSPNIWASKNRKEWEEVKGQGEDVKRMLSLYFCCREYYEVRESDVASEDTLKILPAATVDSMHIASGATVDAIWRDTCFWKYKSAVENLGN